MISLQISFHPFTKLYLKSNMDVSKVMSELSIDQLVQLQLNLDHEVENKKEELRQMVGRRYRDVLDASNAVKRLNEISNLLVDELREMQLAASLTIGDKEEITDVAVPEPLLIYDFVLLHAFLSQASFTYDDVADVFCLLLADAFHRRIAGSVSFDAFVGGEGVLARFSKCLFERLILAKLDLADRLAELLGRATDWHEVTSCLAALAFLKQERFDALLDLYLAARLNYVVFELRSSLTISLIGIMRMMRDTLRIVDEVFGVGGALVSALQLLTTPDWCPDSIQHIINDQLCDSKPNFKRELHRVNASYSLDNVTSVSLHNKCTAWIEHMCAVARERVCAMSAHFERTEEVIEFVVAIDQLFKLEWSSTVASNSDIYCTLFGDSIIQRFSALMDSELRDLEHEFLRRLATCDFAPQPLFQRRAIKFDALLASGISQELNDLVLSLFEGLRELMTRVNKYVAIGREINAKCLRDAFADSVFQMIQRLFVQFNIPTDYLYDDHIRKEGIETSLLRFDETETVSTEEQVRWLRTFRLFLALIQHEPPVFGSCMNRDARRVALCNSALHFATEFSLCYFMRGVIDECMVAYAPLFSMPLICASETRWLDLVMTFERVDVGDGQLIEVPTQLSRHCFQFLYEICRRVNANAVGHLFTINVTNFVAEKIGSVLAANLSECAHKCKPSFRICAQLLFDTRVLFHMFPTTAAFVDIADCIASKMNDAVEHRLVDEPILRAASVYAQRTAMIFGQLMAEPSLPMSSASMRDKNASAITTSATAIVDVTVRILEVRRLALIPRLSKLRAEDDDRRRVDVQRRYPGETPLQLSHVSSAGGVLTEKISSAASFSSFYDKISTGWFNKN